MSAQSIAAGQAIATIASVYWPLFVALAFVIIALAGIASLFIAAESVHGRRDNVVNFERNPPRVVKRD